jgi:hypothetical protein
MKALNQRGALEVNAKFGAGENTGMVRIDVDDVECDWTTEQGRDELSAIAADLHKQWPSIVHVQFRCKNETVGEMVFVPADNRLS